ncbi:hypothetical protein AMTRI_Chr04g243520 [Amborella trichopoda]
MCPSTSPWPLGGSPFCRENERAALLDFKASHSYPNATSKVNRMNSWKGLNCCEWEGVECYNSSSHVVSLKVDAYLGNIGASAYFEVGLLSSLQMLDLGGWESASRTHTINMGNLSLIKELYMYENQLFGSIPECLCLGSRMSVLDLRGNKLERGIPLSETYLSTLQYLVLSKLYSLRHLYLYDNDFSGDFSFTDFANVSSLQYVDLSANPKLTISHNSLCLHSSLIVSTCFLSTQNQLDTVDLSKNNIGLEVLDLSSDNISGNLPSIFPSNLTILDLSNNKIIGEIIPNLTGGNELTFLSLSNNSLKGPLQSKHFKLPNLVSLHLDNNAFNGTIPRRKSLTILDISRNNLEGDALKYITGLDLSENKLSGPIPLDMGLLKELAMLNLSNNLLTGPIPKSF